VAGATYSKPQLEALWVKAGGKKALASTMAAIALAESGGNASSVNPEGPEHAEGLWQIKGQLVGGNIFNPEVNAANAVAKYNSQGLGAWVTYTSGAYKKYLGSGSTLASKAEGAANDLLGAVFGPGGKLGAEGAEKALEPVVEAGGGVVSTEEGVVGFLKSLTEPSTWLRVAEGVGGIVLFMVGLKTLTRGTAAAGATNVAVSQGRAVKGGVKRAAGKVAEVAAVSAA
jgi:hypothetical protein